MKETHGKVIKAWLTEEKHASRSSGNKLILIFFGQNPRMFTLSLHTNLDFAQYSYIVNCIRGFFAVYSEAFYMVFTCEFR